MSSDLHKFFEPGSVVVVGASATRHKPGNDVIRNIMANEYSGDLYLVNPKGGEILGTKVHSSIQELPEGIDLAVIILPAGANPQAIKECAARGIKSIVLAAGGFAEVDEKGEALQEDLIRTIPNRGHPRRSRVSRHTVGILTVIEPTQTLIAVHSNRKNRLLLQRL